MNLTELCGNGCGTRYEKEYQNKFRDCITFYFDGKVLFERFCYGEGACRVFSVWGVVDHSGTITYKQPFSNGVDASALPHQITSWNGHILLFDHQRFCWQPIRELTYDSQNGYSPIRLLLRRLCKR